MEGRLQGGLYELNCIIAPNSQPSEIAFSAQTTNVDLWHRRLGHINIRSLRDLERHDMVHGLDLKGPKDLAPCHGCAKGKHHQAPFPKLARRRAADIMERIHCDLQGPFDRSINGYYYVLAVVDDYSRKGWKEYLHQKSEAPQKLQDLIMRLETQTDRKLKYVRSDRGGEFIANSLASFFRKKGITHELSAPHTPQQNGVAERFNQTTNEHALAMIHEMDMKPSFWPEAHEYASYTRNRCPTSAIPDHKTPNEVFHGRKPDVSSLRIFGSKCHVRIPPESRSSKLAPRSLDGILCGFERGSKAYKVWIPSSRKFTISRDVIVYEEIPRVIDNDTTPDSAPHEGVSTSDTTPSTPPITVSPPKDSPLEQTDVPPSVEPLPIPTTAPTDPRRTARTSRPTWKKQENDRQLTLKQEKKEQRRQAREAKESKVIEEETTTPTPDEKLANVAYMAAYGPFTPSNYEEAINSPHADEWIKAMKEELGMLTERKTWVVEDLPQGRKEVGCRWVYLLKFDANGNITRYKARLVTQGYSQKPGIDFFDTFSPTANQAVFNVLWHIAASLGWSRAQDDVTGAFLHSDLDSTIYMRQPPGFTDGTKRSLRLIRSLYGLKQASHL